MKVDICGPHFWIQKLTHTFTPFVCTAWLKENLHGLNVDSDVKIISLVRPGSKDLTELFDRQNNEIPLSNDTSFGVGYSPLSDLESLVLNLSKYISGYSFLATYPVFGEDTKIMGFWNLDRITLTVSCAFIDRYVESAEDYFKKKKLLISLIDDFVRKHTKLDFEAHVNSADNQQNESIFLTVTGTSGEAGDDGQIGRGNRVNGYVSTHPWEHVKNLFDGSSYEEMYWGGMYLSSGTRPRDPIPYQ